MATLSTSSSPQPSKLRPPTPRAAGLVKIPLLELEKLSKNISSDEPSITTKNSCTALKSLVCRSEAASFTRTPTLPRGWATPRSLPCSPRLIPDCQKAVGKVPDGIKYEMDRLKSQLTATNKEFFLKDKELKTLQKQVREATRILDKKTRECDSLEERMKTAEQRQAEKAKEHQDLQAEKLKLANKLSTAERHLDKLHEKLSSPVQDNDFSLIINDLKSEVALLKEEKRQLENQLKARDRVIRAKDKELSHRAKQVAETDALQKRLQDSHNQNLLLKNRLNGLREDVKTVLQSQHLKDKEVSRLQVQCNKLEQEISRKDETCNSLWSELELSRCDVASLQSELQSTLDKLQRTSAVASRAVRFEQADGVHGDGTVPFQYFLNETNYLKGEVRRLSDKLRQKGEPIDGSAEQLEHVYWVPSRGSSSDGSHVSEVPCWA